MPAPVLVHLNGKRCVMFAAVYGTFAAVMGGLIALPIMVGIFDGLVAGGLAVFLFFAWFAFTFLALARSRPVALRMDEKGISGYYVDPATWDEIKDVRAFIAGKGHRFLGFELKDPATFRDRQTPWRRYRSWSLGRQNGVHQVVPEMVLAAVTVEELAKTARQFFQDHRA